MEDQPDFDSRLSAALGGGPDTDLTMRDILGLQQMPENGGGAAQPDVLGFTSWVSVYDCDRTTGLACRF